MEGISSDVMQSQRAQQNSPVHKDAAARVERILDEFVGLWKVLQQVFIVDIIHFYNLLLEACEQLCIRLKPQDG